jgi:peroxiredoxin
MKSKSLLILGLSLVVAGVLFFFIVRAVLPVLTANQDINGEAPVAAGEMATDFKLQSLSGKPVTLSSLRGKVVFLNVWATWCGPCREEMPSMETLYEAFKDRQDFVILAVSQDRRGRIAVQPFVERNHLHFDILLDPDNVVGDAYNVSGVPETFIIDRKGRIVAHHMGAFDWSQTDVRQALNELLDSKEG